MMSLGLCTCDSCENEEKNIKRNSKNISSQEHDHNCKPCHVNELHQKKFLSEIKTRETFYN